MIIVDRVPPLKIKTQEITGNVNEEWSIKGLLSVVSLSVKYVIINKIGVANWSPTNHTSGITLSLARFLY